MEIFKIIVYTDLVSKSVCFKTANMEFYLPEFYFKEE